MRPGASVQRQATLHRIRQCSALAFSPANHAWRPGLDFALDSRTRPAPRQCSKPWRCARSWLGSVEPGWARRRPCTAFDDVAAMAAYAGGQCLVDLLHRRPAGQAAGDRKRSASCWLNTAARSARSASRLAIRSCCGQAGSVAAARACRSPWPVCGRSIIADADEELSSWSGRSRRAPGWDVVAVRLGGLPCMK